jgi:quinol monooxygenase YgiN
MAFHSYTVAAEFHTRAEAIEVMKQVVAEVTAPSLDEEGCQIYHWSQGADDPTLFLLYMEWRDKACFEAHVATPHVNARRRSSEARENTHRAGERMAFLSTLESTSRPGGRKR